MLKLLGAFISAWLGIAITLALIALLCWLALTASNGSFGLPKPSYLQCYGLMLLVYTTAYAAREGWHKPEIDNK